MYNNPLYEAAEEAKKIKVLYEVDTGYTLWAKLERFLGVAMTLAVGALIVILWRPEWALWSQLAALLFIGLWLPNSYLGEKMEDLSAYRDVLLLLLLHGALSNPVAAFAVYALLLGLAWLVTRGELSAPAFVFALVYTIFRCLFDSAAVLVGYWDIADWLRFHVNFMNALPLLGMAVGWFIGSLLRND
ncbi:MAG: hypothetical protein NZM28_03910 [Fimbriimonadales bacterium]|nr:hypothetical protein [Fimbriimonadales bacterium]